MAKVVSMIFNADRQRLPLKGGGRPAPAGREGVAALQRTRRYRHPTPDCLRQSDPPPPGEGDSACSIALRALHPFLDPVVGRYVRRRVHAIRREADDVDDLRRLGLLVVFESAVSGLLDALVAVADGELHATAR